MTWYWWTHWFWITTITGVLFEILMLAASVETYPLNSPFINKDDNNSKKEKLLMYPLSIQSDMDDIITAVSNAAGGGGLVGGESIAEMEESPQSPPPSSIIRDSKILHSKEAGNISNDRISENALIDHFNNGSVKQKVPDIDSKNNNNNHSITVNSRTKIDVDSIGNNSSIVSTISQPVGIITNTSQIETSESEEEANITSTSSHLNTDHSEFIDYDDHNSNNNKNSTGGRGTADINRSINSNESMEDSILNQGNSSGIDVSDETKSSYHHHHHHHYEHNRRRPHTLENITKEEEVIRAQIEKQQQQQQQGGERGRKSKVLAEYRHELKYINFSSDAKNLLARSAAAVSLDFDEQDDGNVSSEALSIQRAYILDAGAISGICFAVLGIFCVVTLTGVALYRRRYLNKPQTLSEPDSSAYIDDSTIRDNSDEMYSLDNDSFLNSLEAMTIQNYWTDTVKHTKL